MEVDSGFRNSEHRNDSTREGASCGNTAAQAIARLDRTPAVILFLLRRFSLRSQAIGMRGRAELPGRQRMMPICMPISLHSAPRSRVWWQKSNVSDYQHVKAGDLLVQLKDDDFHAQVSQAEAGVAAAKAAIEDNLRQEQLQQAKIERALAGVEEAKAGILAAQAETAAAQAGLDRTLPERRRQEALFASSATTQQKVEQAVAEEEHSRAQLASGQAGQQQSQALLSSSESAVEAERRGLVVLKSEEAAIAR